MPNGWLSDDELEQEVARLRRRNRRPSVHLLWVVPLLSSRTSCSRTSATAYDWERIDLVLGRHNGSWRVFGWGKPPFLGSCTSSDVPCPGERRWARHVPATDEA